MGTEGFTNFLLRACSQVNRAGDVLKALGVVRGQTGQPRARVQFARLRAEPRPPSRELQARPPLVGPRAIQPNRPAGRVLHFVLTNEEFVTDREADKLLTNEQLEPWSMRGPAKLQP